MNSRYSLLCLILFLFTGTASAQLLNHVTGGGGTSSDTATDVALDDAGNMYVSGTFAGTATFGDYSITATGDNDAFLVKWNADGTVAWARRGGTHLFNDTGDAVTVGPDGSVYWVGTFTALATFDGGENPDGELVSAGDFEAFLAKYTTDGDLLWVRGMTGSGQNTGRNAAVDSDGNVYFIGGVNGVATIQGITLQSSGSSDAFILKFTSDGDVEWGRTVGGSMGDMAYGIEEHPDGGIVISGNFNGIALFDSIPVQSVGLSDVFAAHLTADGEVTWATRFGGVGNEYNRGLAVAPNGDIYLTGSFEDEILVGTDILTSAGFSDIYIAKLSSDGSPVWGRAIGGNGFDFGESVAVDNAGNVYGSGYANETITVETGNGTESYSSAGDNDAYLVVYDPEGNLKSFELAGNTNRDQGAGVDVNNVADRVAVSGWFRSSITIGDETFEGSGGNDVFIAWGEPFGSVSTEDDFAANDPLSLTAYPNPSSNTVILQFLGSDHDNVHISLFDMLGRLVQTIHDGPLPSSSIEFDVTAFATGSYILRAQTDSEMTVTRITVVR